MEKRTSMKDIAQKVGVSTALVSYVLNNKNENRINKAVALKIREVAAALNYRTNQIARSLKTNKTFTLGLIVVDIANPFSANLARIIEDEADKNNYTVLFGSSDESLERSDKLVQTFLDRQVDGLIIAPGENAASQVKLLQEQRIPFVLIDRYFPAIQTNYVAIDNYAASFAAVSHLAICGYKRIGMINFDTTLFNLSERTRGYMHALEKKSRVVKQPLLELVANNYENIKENVERAMNNLLGLDEPVDALLFATNTIATQGLKYANAMKIRVPEELALVSFDKTDVMDLFYSPLTYIDQPIGEMGRLATKILIETIEGSTVIKQLNLPAQLVIRSSTVADKKPLLKRMRR